MINRCCNIFLDLVKGIFPGDVDPPEPLNIYYAFVTPSGSDFFSAGDYGSAVVKDPAETADFLQGFVTAESGAGYTPGQGEIVIWILAASEPLDWEWAFAPIVFIAGETGLTEDKCYETADFTFGAGLPDPARWALYSTTNNNVGEIESNFSTNYSDGAFPAAFSLFVTNLYGANATAGIAVDVDSVQLFIHKTYLTPQLVTSVSTSSDYQNDNFSEVQCP